MALGTLVLRSSVVMWGAACTVAGARGTDEEVRGALSQAVAALQALQAQQQRCNEGHAALQRLDLQSVGGAGALDAAVAQFDAVDADCRRVEQAKDRLMDARATLDKVKSTAPPTPTELQERQVQAKASAPGLAQRVMKAQANVAEVKANAAKGFAYSDAAQKTALAAYQAGDVDAASQLEALRKAGRAHQHAMDAYGEQVRMQQLANEAVQGANGLARCALAPLSDTDCAEAAEVQRVSDVADLLAKKLSHSKSALTKARLESFGVTAELETASDQARELALNYLLFIDRHPGAKGLFGTSTVSFTANSEGGEAAVRLAFGPHASRVLWDSALIVSGPLNKDGGPTSIYGDAPALRKSPALTWATNFRNNSALTSKSGQMNLLYKIGFNARVQEVSYAYFDGVGPWTKVEPRHRPWSVGLQAVGAWVSQDDKDIATWQINLDRKTEWKAAKSFNRCPLPDAGSTWVKCETGAFSPPSSLDLWALTAEYRREIGMLGLTPRLGIERASSFKKDRFELPVYFIRDSSPKPKLTAGISYTWERTRDASQAVPQTSISRLYSLFFSVPFAMFEP